MAFIDGSNYSEAATGNGTVSKRGGAGERSLATSNHLSMRGAASGAGNVGLSGGRSGNNSHSCLAAPPAPGVSFSMSVLFAQLPPVTLSSQLLYNDGGILYRMRTTSKLNNRVY